MREKMLAEKNTRIQILRNLGMRKELCDRMEDEDDFVLGGYAMEPKPDFTECRKLKQEFEARQEAIVLCGILDTLYGVQCLSFIYVSRYENDWELDRKELMEGRAVVEVCNLTEHFSELGGIAFQMNGEGYPVRTA